MRRRSKVEGKTIDLGITLYDLNKQLMVREYKLTEEQIDAKLYEGLRILRKPECRYAMLLCNERKDYTVFNFNDRNVKTEEVIEDIKDCLLKGRNLTVLSIENTQNDGSIEIWVRDGEKAPFCYYLFDYTFGVIEY